MKVTFVLSGFPVKPTGGFKMVYAYADFLAGHGYEVSIVHAYMFPEEKRFQGFSGKINFIIGLIKMLIRCFQVEVFKYNMWNVDWFIFENKVKFRYCWYPLERKIPEGDAIFATAFETANFVYHLNTNKGSKFYFIQHFETWAASEAKVIESWQLPMCKVVIASWLQEIGNKIGVKTALIPNFIDKGNFYESLPIDDSARDSIVMLYHFLPVKGSDYGIEALRRVKRKKPNLRIVLFGTSERPNLIPDNFVYFQNPSKDFLRDNIYNKALVYLMPSLQEGWGLTATEAMACGAALVSTDNGGVNDFAIDSETAFIVGIRDVNAMEKAVEKLIENDELRKRMATAGKSKVEEFSVENSGEKLITLINSKIAHDKIVQSSTDERGSK